MIGVQAEVPLIATNKYQAMFQKRFENEKLTDWLTENDSQGAAPFR